MHPPCLVGEEHPRELSDHWQNQNAGSHHTGLVARSHDMLSLSAYSLRNFSSRERSRSVGASVSQIYKPKAMNFSKHITLTAENPMPWM